MEFSRKNYSTQLKKILFGYANPIIFIISLFLPLTFWVILCLQQSVADQEHFHQEVNRIENEIRKKMGRYEVALEGAAAFVETLNTLPSESEWKSYSNELQMSRKFPGIQGIGIVYRSNKDSTFTSVYESSSEKDDSFKFDFNDDLVLKHAMQSAEDNDLIEMSQPTQILKQSQTNDGLVLFLSFSKAITIANQTPSQKLIQGFIFAPLLINEFLDTTIPRGLRLVDLKITQNSQTVFDETKEADENPDQKTLFNHKDSIKIFGSQWDIEFRTNEDFVPLRAGYNPFQFFFIGVLFNLLMIALLYFSNLSKRKTLKFARNLVESVKQEEEAKFLEVSDREEFFRKAIEFLPAVLFCKEYKNGFGTFRIWNRSAEKYIGIRAEDALGKTDFDLFPEEQATYFQKMDLQTLSERKEIYIDEEPVASPTTGPRWFRTWKIPFQTKDNRDILMGICIDITKQKEYEIQYKEEKARSENSARLASLGEMAGNIAHEINNPLATLAVIGISIRNSIRKKNFSEFESFMDQYDKTVERIAAVVRSMKSLGRDASTDPFSLQKVDELIEDALVLCGGKFKNNGIQVFVENEAEGTILSCRSVEISQVLLNLLNNTYSAICGTHNPWVKIKTYREGDDIIISVIDSGTGIESSIAARIMDPFFTTKNPGEGTGLGLSISKRIVESHGGQLLYDNSTSNTTFSIKLPLQGNSI